MCLRSLYTVIGLVCSSLLANCFGQPIERVLVEKYHVQENAAGGAPLITYRVYLDLAEGHYLQMVYGDEHHALRLETTTEFHNSASGNVRFGDRLAVDPKDFTALAIDSWLTIGLVGSQHVGIPRELDPDGSILECGSGDPKSGDGTPPLDALCQTDGLHPQEQLREVVNFLLEPSYLGNMRGAIIETNDGAWAMLGGMKGPTPQNLVLIAQFATTGELHFVLNAQVGTPDGGYVKIVAKDPREGELQLDALTYGKRRLN